MNFHRLLLNALFIGTLAGVVLSVLQLMLVHPIIFAAEVYEIADHDHAPDEIEPWSPEDGLERTLYSVAANLGATIGFSAILLALMNQFISMGRVSPHLRNSLLWGLGGFIVFFSAPALGLPPEIPGVEAPALEGRQAWWLFCVVATLIALLVLAFAPFKIKPLGFLLIGAPFLVLIQHGTQPLFSHPDPAVLVELTKLHSQFIIMTSATNFVLWLLIAVASGWVMLNWQRSQANA